MMLSSKAHASQVFCIDRVSIQFDALCSCLRMIAYILEYAIRAIFFIVMDIVGFDNVLLIYCLAMILNAISWRKHLRDGSEEVSSFHDESALQNVYGE